MQQLEDEVLRLLLSGDDPVLAVLRSQLTSADRMPREMTGVGFFTYFHLPADAPRLPDISPFAFGDVVAEVDGLQHGAGFVLFLRDGVLDVLEGYCYDETWPTPITSFRLSYLNAPNRDFDSLRATIGWPREQ